MTTSETRARRSTVADELGVSARSVSNAYNKPDQLSAALRKRILKTAGEVGYAPSDIVTEMRRPEPDAEMVFRIAERVGVADGTILRAYNEPAKVSDRLRERIFEIADGLGCVVGELEPTPVKVRRHSVPTGRTPEEIEVLDVWMSLGFSPRTIKVYLGAVRSARRWADENGYDLATIGPRALIDYAETVPRTFSSRSGVRSALKAYWEAIDRTDPPLKAIRAPRKARMRSKALDDDIAKTLGTAAIARCDRPGVAVLIGLYLGLRREEISAVSWDDFDDTLSWVTVIGKGYSSASLPVHPTLRNALLRFRATPAGSRSVYLFPGRFTDHVVPTTVWNWVRQVANDAGLDNVPTHVLRHTCLTTANDTSGDLRTVQALARHSRPETTAGYTRVNTDRLKAVVLALDFDNGAIEA